MNKNATTQKISIEQFISKITGLPKDVWIQHKDLEYLYNCVTIFKLNPSNYAGKILDTIGKRLVDQNEVDELINHTENLLSQAREKSTAESDIFIAQAIEILANDFWLLHEMKKQGAIEENIRLLKNNIENDSIEVGKRLIKNAIRKVEALKKTAISLDHSKVKPLFNWVNEGHFDINKKIMLPADLKRIHLIINAGRSTRVRTTIPKGVIYLGGKPLIQHTIDAGREAGIEKTIVVLGFKKSVNEAFLEEDILTALQPTVEGTAHAVMSVYPVLKNFTGTLLVSYSDMPFIKGTTLKELLTKNESNDSAMSILTTLREKRPEFGRLIKDAKGNYLRIAQVRIEETESDQVDAGFYCFKCPDFWEYLGKVTNENNRYEYYLTDVVEKLSDTGEAVLGYETEDEIETFGINRPSELMKAFEMGYFLFGKKYSYEKLNTLLNNPSNELKEEVVNFYCDFSRTHGNNKKLTIDIINNAFQKHTGAIFQF